jgi:RNA polymerase sigma-70 factor (ECF subfamily)
MTSTPPSDIDARFERLFDEYQGAILNYLYRMVNDRDRAEELTQDVFVKAYRALRRLPADANERAWLYRIATNTAYDRLRRARLIRWLPLLENKDSLVMSGDRGSNIAEREAVQEGLAQLKPLYRAPLILYSVQGYSVAEIAEMLGISEGAVKTRLYRAREKFRKAYGGEGGDAL